MTIATMTKRFKWEGAHQLTHLPTTHDCSRLHGHSYRVEVIAVGEIDPKLGWFKDYAEMSEVMRPLIDRLDHRNVNEVFDQSGWSHRPTTAENLCLWFLDRLPPWIAAVRVFETETTCVEVRR